jgi:hypothetical protein
MTQIRIERENDTRLKRDVWTFFYLDNRHVLRLSGFEAQQRPSLRHKYRTEALYSFYRGRETTVPTPPLPEDVKVDAIRQFTERLTVEM